jgi:hypothetical protein
VHVVSEEIERLEKAVEALNPFIAAGRSGSSGQSVL